MSCPPGGTARFASPLNVLDFVKISSIVQLDDATPARLSPIAARIAQAEGLTAHANAAQRRVVSGRGAAEWRPHPRNLVRPDIAAMEAYTPILPFEVLSQQLGRPPEAIIKLDANENPYGPSPRRWQALATAACPHLPRPRIQPRCARR